MIQWTDAARAKLEQYLAQTRLVMAGSGADAEEVAEDLRRHVEEEAAARNLTVVTEQDVAQILARIGGPEAAFSSEAQPAEPKHASRAVGRGWAWRVGAGTLFVFGVLLPLGTVVFEFLTGSCAGVLFDPIPTLAHAVLVALVPLVNLAVLVAVCRRERRWRAALGWASGLAMGVALVYALLFLPVTPFAVLGIAVFGFGFVPLAALSALVCGLILRAQLRQAVAVGILPGVEPGVLPGGTALPGGRMPPSTAGKMPAATERLPGLWRGLGLGAALVVVLTLPAIVTKLGLQMAASDAPAEQERGVRWLRHWGQREDLLRACYGRTGRASGIYDWGKRVNPETARGIYYRVTGRAFNSVPPPKLYAGRARWSLMEEEFTWDDDQGGDAVAGRVRGLSLMSSRQDAVVYPEAALAYVEWTLEFKNDSSLQREARAQIALPPGAVVSRLTLWIDGEEREAAFGGRSQVKSAYKAVVQQRRDPVLVSTCGPDRVLMQCFPVPPRGGRMKVRLGITAPLALTAADVGSLRWPCFAERNFTIGDQFQHSLWVQSPYPLEAAGSRLKAEQVKPHPYSLRGQVRDEDLWAPSNSVRARRPAEEAAVWTRDPRAPETQVIRQTVVEKLPTAPDRVVMVVDTSKGMGNYYRAVETALSRLPAEVEVAVLLARNGCEEAMPVQKSGANIKAKAVWLARMCEAWTSAGGEDNLAVLVRAWDLAAQAKAGVVVWVHGPQPVSLSSAEELRQRFERSANPPLLLEAQTQPGPNRVLEELDGLDAVRPVTRLGELADDLGRLFAGWGAHAGGWTFVRERVGTTSPNAMQGVETSSHLARLWAAEEVARLRAQRRVTEATQTAVRNQLVTPVSGAVVLETQAQYKQAGLQPAPSESVPTVPEPSAGALMILGLIAVAASRRKRQSLIRTTGG